MPNGEFSNDCVTQLFEPLKRYNGFDFFEQINAVVALLPAGERLDLYHLGLLHQLLVDAIHDAQRNKVVETTIVKTIQTTVTRSHIERRTLSSNICIEDLTHEALALLRTLHDTLHEDPRIDAAIARVDAVIKFLFVTLGMLNIFMRMQAGRPPPRPS